MHLPYVQSNRHERCSRNRTGQRKSYCSIISSTVARPCNGCNYSGTDKGQQPHEPDIDCNSFKSYRCHLYVVILLFVSTIVPLLLLPPSPPEFCAIFSDPSPTSVPVSSDGTGSTLSCPWNMTSL